MDQLREEQEDNPSPRSLILRVSPVLSGAVLGTTLFLVTAAVLGLIAFTGVRQHERIAEERLRGIASAAVTLVDGDLHEQLQRPEDTGSPLYERTIARLVDFHNANPQVYWIYTMRVRQGELYYVLDTSASPRLKLQRDPELIVQVMEPVREFYIEDEPGLMPAMLAGRTHVDRKTYLSSGRWFRSAQAPIRNSQGTVVAILAADVEVAIFQAERRSFLVTIALAAGVCLLLSVGLGLLATRTHQRLRQAVTRLEQESITDALTGLNNRSFFNRSLGAEIAQARRAAVSFALLVFDIDHFKRINDQFGHPSGDEVLRTIGERLRAEVREGDICCRIGGEEFALLMPQIGRHEAEAAFQRLRTAIRGPIAVDGAELQITISGGIATLGGDGDDGSVLMRRADNALYEAKNSGRDRVVLAD